MMGDALAKLSLVFAGALQMIKLISARLLAVSISCAVGACSSIGPSTVMRDSADYGGAIGESSKQQTLLNIVRLRYSDFPMFMEVSQVIAGYQLQTTASAGLSIQNYITASDTNPPGVVGQVGVGATYTDRPTVIYSPLTGNDFMKKLMSPLPASAVLSLLQSGYPATMVLPLAR